MIRAVASSDYRASRGRLLVVDDDRRVASNTAQWLCGLGWHASAVGHVAEALPLLARDHYDACIVDGMLAAGGASRIAAALRNGSADTALVVTMPVAGTADATIVADALVRTPLRDDDLLAAINGAMAAAAGRAATARHDGPPAPKLLGESSAIRRVLDLVARLADAPATLLITGESGTGKSLVAREMHRVSRRREGRFVEVACGSLSESLLESELFGHVAGAFTGATADRDGKFLQADGGTIFLDEIATASPAMQVKLLRVLQDLRFEAVGGSRTHAVDARVILATNEDLAVLVAAGAFRADLFWRVNVITIEMPALRDRADDIPMLAEHFLASSLARGPRAVDGFSSAAIESLCRYRWPGNVRELEHAVEFAVFLGRGSSIDVADLPAAVRHGGCEAGQGGAAAAVEAAGSLKQDLAHPERKLIIEALERHSWRRDAAARALGINRTSLYKKLKRLGINLAELQPAR
ncbi:MAG: sigma-54-dependent Fis family transcriptional regulator [Planctomycetes bacterium]|nr:sigma-54-dependent Fis family transcriptional regulator [Planctomycetota bacterium]